MRRTILLFALLFAAGAAVAAPEPASVLDPDRDPRLAQRVRLHSEGIPLRKVIAALKERTGISLRVDGAPGDQRLIAFVSDAPVAEALESIAELYRLTWQRESGAEPAYRLVKPLRTAQDEAALRNRALRELLARLGDRLRNPDLPQDRPARRPEVWRPVYPSLFPIVLARGDELIREGYAYLPLGALPPEQREPLLNQMRPILKGEDDRRTVALDEIRQQEIQMGIPEDQATSRKPPSNAEMCVFTVDLSLPGAPRASVGLRTDSETWYNWFEIDGDPLVQEAIELYPDRKVRVPDAQPAAGPVDDPLHRPVQVPADPGARKGDWIGALARVSSAAKVAVYADCYTAYSGGYAAHPRAKWVLSERTSVSQAVDGLCAATVFTGAGRRVPNGFWWTRNGSVLIRSRRWLWEVAGMLPAALTDRITASLRATGMLRADNLPQLAALSWPQVQALEMNGRAMDIWNLGVRAAGRLSPAARAQLVSAKLAWSQLSVPDRQILAPFLSPVTVQERDPTAQIRIDLREVPEQGAVLAVMNYWAMGNPRGRPAYLALPGVDLKLQPRGLEVQALMR